MGHMPAESPKTFNHGQAADATPLVERFATEGTATAHGIVDVACNVRELSLRMAAQESLLSSVDAKMAELGKENRPDRRQRRGQPASRRGNRRRSGRVA